MVVVNATQDNSDRKKLLEAQLNIGKDCTPEQRAAVIDLMKHKHDVFTLTDQELGETELVEHSMT